MPRELDWVKARAACSLAKVFSELHDAVDEDVRKANEVCPPSPSNPGFELVVSPSRDVFKVRRLETINPVVTFSLEVDRIHISSSLTNEQWNYTVGLNGEGRCVLRQSGDDFEKWQVRKTALEGLFFPV